MSTLTVSNITGTNFNARLYSSSDVLVEYNSQYSVYMAGNQINSGYNYNGSTELAINYSGYLSGTTQFRDVRIFDGKNTQTTLFQGSNKTLYSYGDVVAFTSSDARLKNNVTKIDNALLKVTEIRGVTFDWNDEYMSHQPKDDYFNRKHDVGVIAQEIEKVLPEAVATRDDGIKAVKYEKIIPLLIEAIKELKEEIEQLKKDR
jgi:hypothetical protein